MKYIVFFPLLIIALVIALYAHTLSYGYVYLDDTLLLQQSSSFLHDPHNFGRIFQQEVFTAANRGEGIFYRPLLTVSFFLDTQLFGGSLLGYRVSSLFLHGVASVLVWFLLHRLGSTRFVCGSAALLFAVHPLSVQTVAWLPGRNDLLLAVWVFVSVWWYAVFAQTGKRWYLIGHLVCFLLAVFTKETALVVPVICLFLSFFVFPTYRFRRALIPAGLVWIGGGVLLMVARSLFLSNADSYALGDMIGNIFFQLPGVIIYIGKAFLPVRLSVYPDMADLSVLPGLAVCLAVAGLLWHSRQRRWQQIGLGILWLVLFLLPTMTIREKYSSGILREHRMYLPLVGLFLILGEIDWVKRLSWRTVSHRWVIAAVVSILFFRAWQHTSTFADSRSFWTNAVETSPHAAVAHINLGAVDAQDGQWSGAISQYRQALVLAPEIIGGHNNLGVVYLAQHRYQEAAAEFRRELSLHPDFSMAQRNLNRLEFHP